MKAVLIILLIVFTGAFIGCVYWGIMLYSMKHSGIITIGRIINYEETNYRYTIKFETIDSIEEIIELDLPKKYAKVGGPIQIMYDPAKPRLAQVVNNKMHLTNCIGGIVFLSALIASVVWCVFNMKKAITL